MSIDNGARNIFFVFIRGVFVLTYAVYKVIIDI